MYLMCNKWFDISPNRFHDPDSYSCHSFYLEGTPPTHIFPAKILSILQYILNPYPFESFLNVSSLFDPLIICACSASMTPVLYSLTPACKWHCITYFCKTCNILHCVPYILNMHYIHVDLNFTEKNHKISVERKIPDWECLQKEIWTEMTFPRISNTLVH